MPRLNVQADVRARLAKALAPAEVRVSVPDPRPESLVVVTREGGRRLNSLQDRAGIGLLIWAPTEEKARALADAAGDAMMALRFEDGYEVVTEETMRSEPDDATDPPTPRWYASYTLTTHNA